MSELAEHIVAAILDTLNDRRDINVEMREDMVDAVDTELALWREEGVLP